MHSDVVLGVAVASDGERVATASDDRTARIYSCSTCEPLDDLVALARSLVTRTISPVERADFLDVAQNTSGERGGD
jgi:WD40 repeat protein